MPLSSDLVILYSPKSFHLEPDTCVEYHHGCLCNMTTPVVAITVCNLPCRFNDVFARTEQGLPRNWSPSANIPHIAQQARQSAARLLAMLAVIRLHATKV